MCVVWLDYELGFILLQTRLQLIKLLHLPVMCGPDWLGFADGRSLGGGRA